MTPYKITKFLASTTVKSIESMLTRPRDHTKPPPLDLVINCRNYLTFRVLLSNGQRSNVLVAETPAALDKTHTTMDGAVITVSVFFK